MKSCVFIALIVVFINIILIEKSHCLPAAIKNGYDGDNSTINELDPNEVMHALTINASEVDGNVTDFTNDSSVAGKDKNIDKPAPVNDLTKAESKGEQKSKQGKGQKGEKVDRRPTDKQKVPPETTLVQEIPGDATSTLGKLPHVSESTVETGLDVETAPSRPSPLPDDNSQGQNKQDFSQKVLEPAKKPLPPVVQTTKTPKPATEVNKPAEKKTQGDPSDEKDMPVAVGDEDQPELENTNDLLPPEDKKDPPPTIAEKQKDVVEQTVEDLPSKKINDANPRPVFPEQENSHFFVYFMTVVSLCVIGYFLFHNKQKIIALIVEGRHDRRRRAHSYRKLENEGTKGSPAIF